MSTNTTTGLKRVHCKLCNKTFRHEKSYTQHKSVHKGSTRCPICDKILCRKYQLKVHLSNLHGIKKFQFKKKEIRKPVKRQLPVETMDCSVCGKKFTHKKSLELHMVVHAGKTECPVCKKVLSRQYELKRHLRNSHNVEEA